MKNKIQIWFRAWKDQVILTNQLKKVNFTPEITVLTVSF